MLPLENITDDRRYRSDIIELPSVRYTMLTINFLVILMGAIGNGSVIYFLVRYRHRSRKSTTTYLLVNLAICDFFVTTVHQPLRVMDILLPFATTGPLKITLTYCKLTAFLASVFSAVGFHTLVLIGLERFILICLPFRAPWVTVGNTWKAIGVVWIVALCNTLPLPVHFTYIARVSLSGTDLDFCLVDLFDDECSGWLTYYTVIFAFYYVIPVIALIFFYVMIFRTLNKGVEDLPTGDASYLKMVRKRRSLAKLLLSIAIIFVILHSPFFIGFFMLTYGFKGPNNPIFGLLLVESLVTLNSAIDPFIYCAQSRSFFRRKMFSLLSSNVEDRNSKRVMTPLLTSHHESNRSPRESPRYQLRSILEHQGKDSPNSSRSSLAVTDRIETPSNNGLGSTVQNSIICSSNPNGNSGPSVNGGFDGSSPDGHIMINDTHTENNDQVTTDRENETDI